MALRTVRCIVTMEIKIGCFYKKRSVMDGQQEKIFKPRKRKNREFEIRDIKVFLEHLDKLQTVKRKEM